jgi:hypothetical protein
VNLHRPVLSIVIQYSADAQYQLHHVLLIGARFASSERASGRILANPPAFTQLLVVYDSGWVSAVTKRLGRTSTLLLGHFRDPVGLFGC